MESNTITIEFPQDIPQEWNHTMFKSNRICTYRESDIVESFDTSWGLLVSNPELDIILSCEGKEYPCKRDIFFKTYEQIPGTDTYRKSHIAELVQIPPGFEVQIVTLEGNLPAVKHPDYIVIGAEGELYANTDAHVRKNLIAC